MEDLSDSFVAVISFRRATAVGRYAKLSIATQSRQRRARIGGQEAVVRTERVEHREVALCGGEAGRAFDER